MTTDEVFASIVQQNDVIITLLARLVWTPEKLVAAVTERKKSPDAYVSVYNALDGVKTVTQLAVIAGVKQPTMTVMLQSWLEDGIVLDVGTPNQPKYRRLMRLPEKRKTKEKAPETQGAQETNDTTGQ